VLGIGAARELVLAAAVMDGVAGVEVEITGVLSSGMGTVGPAIATGARKGESDEPVLSADWAPATRDENGTAVEFKPTVTFAQGPLRVASLRASALTLSRGGEGDGFAPSMVYSVISGI
jgi:hypothetical protein